MAHDIFYNSITGQDSFFSVKEKAWHGLGQIVQDYPTSQEAMQFAGLDYDVVKTPLHTYGSAMIVGEGGMNVEPKELPVSDYYATIRPDHNIVLGIVGKDYEIVQNRDAFAFFDAIVGGGDGIKYETAGALGKGERIFITAKLPDYITVGNNDLLEQYLFLTTSHDGSGSITAAFTPIRVVCRNTLNAAMGKLTNTVKIRHTASAKDRLAQAHRVMDISRRTAAGMGEVFNRFANVRITDKALLQLIQQAMVPNKEVLEKLRSGADDELSAIFKNSVNEVYSYALSNSTQQTETTKGTVFGAYNAVTGYFQNVRKYKTQEKKLESIMFGGVAHERGQKAFNLCMDYAKHGEEALKLN